MDEIDEVAVGALADDVDLPTAIAGSTRDPQAPMKPVGQIVAAVVAILVLLAFIWFVVQMG